MAEPLPPRHLASHIFNIAVLVVGGGLLAVMMHRLGWATTRDIVTDVGAWFVVILGIDVAGLACESAAIHAFMGPDAQRVSYAHVFAAQASGRAVNIVTPGGTLGEATKVSMLATHAPRARAVSSIVLYNLASLYLSVTIVLVGVPLTALMVDLPHDLQVIVWTALSVMLALVIGLAVLVRRGALETALAAGVRLRLVKPAHVAQWQDKIADVDSHLGELFRDRSAGTRIGIAMIAAAQLCAWSSTLVMLHVVGLSLHLSLVVGILSVGVAIGWASSIVPFGIGIADGSNYALFQILGAPPAAGIAITMINRVRSLAIALLGLAIMAIGHAANRISLARRRAHRSVSRDDDSMRG
jgi:uncharacterized membrane protein YbhN (UPF0104 family)